MRSQAQVSDADDSTGDLLSPEEARALFDREARRLLGIPGTEFLRRWDAGEFDVDGPDHGKLISLSLLIPFGRR